MFYLDDFIFTGQRFTEQFQINLTTVLQLLNSTHQQQQLVSSFKLQHNQFLITPHRRTSQETAAPTATPARIR